MSGRQRNLRKKRVIDGDEDGGGGEEEARGEALEDLKLLQRQRKRTAGMDAAALAAQGGTGGDDGNADDDNELMDTYVKAQAGGNMLDEEAQMQQYIERELARRTGKRVDDGEQQLTKQQLEELELYKVPEALQVS